VAADGSGEPEAIVEGRAPTFSADTKRMVFVRDGGEKKGDLWSLSLDETSEAAVFLQTDADETEPALSPDGRFVAYVSDESGGHQIYVKPHPGGTGRWQASVDGGREPHWSPTGDRLYFDDTKGKLRQVSFAASPRVVLGTPEVLVDSRVTPFAPFRRYNVAPDGKRFVVVRNVKKDEAEEEPVDGIYVVENWFADFATDR
jgi:serine/threonine-protein kinase